MEIITPIIVCLVIVLTLTGILLLAKSFLVSSGKVKITINKRTYNGSKKNLKAIWENFKN